MTIARSSRRVTRAGSTLVWAIAEPARRPQRSSRNMMGRIIAQRPGAPAGKVDPCRKSRKVPLRSPYGEHYARGGYSCWNQAMDIVDALLFALLAAGDMALIVHLRKRRNRRL